MSVEKAGISLTVQKASRLYLQDCKIRNLTKETLRRYRYSLNKFEWQLDCLNKTLPELTAPDLTHRIIADMLNEGASLRTVNCHIAVLKELFKFLMNEGLIEQNVAISLKPFKARPSMTHTFTDEHLQRLLAQPNRTTFTGFRNYVMMMVLLETGVRLKELANLTLSDILFQEGLIRIQQGKGRKPRFVPIQRSCATLVRQYLQERGELEHHFMWVNLDNSPFEAPGIRIMISRYCLAANIKGIKCSCHTFRHTFAKLYLLHGGDVFTLKAIMGHERMETTEMYVEIFSRDLQTQHEKNSPLEKLANEFPFIIDKSGVNPHE